MGNIVDKTKKILQEGKKVVDPLLPAVSLAESSATFLDKINEHNLAKAIDTREQLIYRTESLQENIDYKISRQVRKRLEKSYGKYGVEGGSRGSKDSKKLREKGIKYPISDNLSESMSKKKFKKLVRKVPATFKNIGNVVKGGLSSEIKSIRQSEAKIKEFRKTVRSAKIRLGAVKSGLSGLSAIAVLRSDRHLIDKDQAIFSLVTEFSTHVPRLKGLNQGMGGFNLYGSIKDLILNYDKKDPVSISFDVLNIMLSFANASTPHMLAGMVAGAFYDVARTFVVELLKQATTYGATYNNVYTQYEIQKINRNKAALAANKLKEKILISGQISYVTKSRHLNTGLDSDQIIKTSNQWKELLEKEKKIKERLQRAQDKAYNRNLMEAYAKWFEKRHDNHFGWFDRSALKSKTYWNLFRSVKGKRYCNSRKEKTEWKYSFQIDESCH